MQERRHVRDIVDAAAQLVGLSDVIDSDEQGAATACAGGVLEVVVRGGAVAKVLVALGWGWGEVFIVGPGLLS